MDAHALLSAQGWRGTGHSLHVHSDSIGLAKPLLLSRKDNTKGLGQKQHFTSDQWWMNAFDEQLKGLDTSKDGQVVQTITTGKLNAVEKGSLGKYALYTSFVRGGMLEGTALNKGEQTDTLTKSDDTAAAKNEKKLDDLATIETKEERRARRESKRLRKKQRAVRREKRARDKEAPANGKVLVPVEKLGEGRNDIKIEMVRPAEVDSPRTTKKKRRK